MNETPFQELAVESSKRGRDPKTRRLLLILFIVWLFTLVGFLGLAWNAYFHQKAATQSLAQQIAHACNSGVFGPGMQVEDEKKLCSKAKKEAADNSLSLGIQGPQGPRGEQGPPGPQGYPGLQGPTGLQGIMGVHGKNGQPGLDGDVGPTGPTGPAGPQGEKGATGDKGDTGAQGDTGPQGTSAFPFTFTFTIPGHGLSPGDTFTCTVTAPDTPVTCQEAA
jgi:hypothetical protein